MVQPSPLASDVTLRLEAVRARITQACAAAGRAAESVRLLAVSKGQPASAVREAYAAGQRDFGENYVQELVAKARELSDLPGLRWHMIGNLQRNKAKEVVPLVEAVHTVDRAELAQELAKRAAERSEPLPVFVEVNVGGEEQKGGCAPAELGALLGVLRELPQLRVVGLMTVPPDVDEAEQARPYFGSLRGLRDAHLGPQAELSMGMSHDLDAAVAEGATWVRVGTAIFGPRAPRKA